jgi:hypothetical protein
MKSEPFLPNNNDLLFLSSQSKSRGRFSKSLIAALILLASMILLTDTPCRAQNGNDAMFIDQEGNVGLGQQAPRAKLDVNGTILGIGMVPPGGIVMFHGDIDTSFDPQGRGRKNTPYEGWQLCNGNNGSPDLQDRFIAAAGRKYPMGHKSGSDTVTLKVAQLPSHNHGGNTKPSPPLYLNYGGVRWNSKGVQQRGIVLHVDKSGLPRNRPNKITTARVGPEIAVRPPRHSHPIPAQGSGTPVDIRPSFFTLAFIMRLPVLEGERK